MQLPPPDVAPITWTLSIESRFTEQQVLQVDGWSRGFADLIEQLQSLPAGIAKDFGPGKHGFPAA
jgi:hypothetical protein